MESTDQIQDRARYLALCSRRLCRYAFITAIFSGMAAYADAQTFAEWFNQKKTQKKYLLDQIAALQVYSGYLRNGYYIAQKGLGSISGSVHSEFNLHQDYFRSLTVVKPSLADQAVNRQLMELAEGINRNFSALGRLDYSNNEERKYISSVGTRVLADCEENLLLYQRINSGAVYLSDHDRVMRNSQIVGALKSNYRFSISFTAQVMALIKARESEKIDNLKIKNLYNR
ncbi:hypothetical protein [Mucilaginibacter ginkgonis]|uniref:Uncharacterized protein n=1 Tax=Mucilaginibacter ginkgonis TaxID=2682091 RepID=A0A6I4HZM9_9SPHI|nr:hypothetical protein [Mucilaginibacter ginkgonis]QQL49965.1 hypothetical protein GO620_000500 [Mucilaginibacter ginkgonis]